MSVVELAKRARAASIVLGTVSSADKNTALLLTASKLISAQAEILLANENDLRAAREKGLKESFIERLTLNEMRIRHMAQGLIDVAQQTDPIGEILGQWSRPSGISITKRRVPLGVCAIIYESRPNVTIDAAALCLKSGNAVILRGGSDAIYSNMALCRVLNDAIKTAGLPDGSVQLLEDTSREAAAELMTLNRYIDVLIPRGGKGLIASVVENATVPVIQTGDGICHIYVDRNCDMEMAVKVSVSAKVSRPSVCNSAETLLVHEAVALEFLPQCIRALKSHGVTVRGCDSTRVICPDVEQATDEDWDTEYNDLIYSIKVVVSIDSAIEHINLHGTRHSESIITGDEVNARRFLDMVDAAAVYVNTSTRFTDGGEFGFGAEIGISNQKLHARGPMGLTELTTYKYEIRSDGKIR